MPNPIQQFSIAEFEAHLASWSPIRRIDSVHLHCTDRPRHADWRGLASVEAMRRFHISIGMSDIAQHVTVDPRGRVWTGRPFDVVPASARGHNGTAAVGPFMIEMVGLFERGIDVFGGAQRDAAYAVVVAVLQKFGLDASAVKFHREFPGTGKTCPGLDLDPAAVRAGIKALLDASSARSAGPHGVRGGTRRAASALRARAAARAAGAAGSAFDAVEDVELAGDLKDYEVPEDAEALASQQAIAETLDRAGVSAGDATGQRALRALRAADDIDPRFRELVGHVINTSQGVLSGKGLMQNTTLDLDTLINRHLAPAVASGAIQHIVFYAHGGLVSERSALCYAKTILPWWLAQGIYPIFFVWESDLFSTILNRPRAARGFGDFGDFWDKGVEVATQLLARQIWARMKANARACSAPMTGHGKPGGLFEFAQRFHPWYNALPATDRPKLHAIGHSTGPILLKRFMPRIYAPEREQAFFREQGHPFDSLSYLAPAIRIDDFAAEVLRDIGPNKSIRGLDIYTMNERAERDDDVVKIYRKSLLYYVRNACEDRTNGRIVGLQEDLFADGSLVAEFKLGKKSDLTAGDSAKNLRIEFSQHEDQSPQNRATVATTHGGFDNDEATLSSVARRILGLAATNPLPLSGERFPSEKDFDECRAEGRDSRSGDDADQDQEETDEAFADGASAFAAADASSGSGPCPCCPYAGGHRPSEFDAPAGGYATALGNVDDTPAATIDAPAPWSDAQAPAVLTARAGRRLAVCIGIDEYRDSPLAGCVNDSVAWAKRLTALGFKVTALKNRNATRSALAGALEKLVTNARPGDELVFQFAGHGSQVTDTDGDETDRFDEVLCPVDYHKGELFIDDDLYAITAQLGVAAGAYLTFLMDCCHSGTNTRAAPPKVRPRAGQDRRGRFLTLPDVAVEKYLALRARQVRTARALGTPSERDALPGVVSFAACRDREVALENNGQGDFTRHALAVFDGVLDERGSNAAFLSAVVRRFGDAREQTPQMQDPLPALRRRAFLGGRP